MRRLNYYRENLSFLTNRRANTEVFGMFGAGNLGDEAMRVAALKFLPEKTVVTANMGWKKGLFKRALQSKTRENLVIGGGALVHGGTTDWLDYVESRFANGARLYFIGTGLAFLPEQASFNYPPFSRWARLLNGAQLVALRGPISVALAEKMNVEAEIFGDMAFSLHNKFLPSTARKGPTIGVNIGECLRDQHNFEERFALLLRRLKTDFCFEFYAVTKSDIPPTLRVASDAGISLHASQINKEYWNPQRFMCKVKDHDIFFGLKLHAAGLAMIAGTPTIMLNYLPKCDDFVAPIGAQECLADLPLEVKHVEKRIYEIANTSNPFAHQAAIERFAKAQRDLMRSFQAVSASP